MKETQTNKQTSNDYKQLILRKRAASTLKKKRNNMENMQMKWKTFVKTKMLGKADKDRKKHSHFFSFKLS